MNIAKNIKGIRHFLDTSAQYGNWHIMTRDNYIAFSEWTAVDIIAMMSENGYVFVGFTGNGLCFE